MNKNKKNAIGIDLGGTKMLTALIDKNHKISSKVKEKTKVEKGEKYFLETLLDSVQQLLDEAGLKARDLAGIGIGVPGVVDGRQGMVISAPNVAFMQDYPLGAKLKKLLGIPVVLENDVNAGLYGEYRFGAAKGHRHVVGIFIGTGIGGALILNGELYRGTSGAAGELGHMFVDAFGPKCGCGKTGCLEALAGRMAIASEAAVLAAKQQAPHLFDLAGTSVSEIKSGVLAKSIRLGDRAIRDLVQSKARLVGGVAANIVNLLNPDLIVLGGGVVEALPDLIVKEVRDALKEHAMEPLAKKVDVVVSKLGDDSVVQGAAQLAREAED